MSPGTKLIDKLMDNYTQEQEKKEQAVLARERMHLVRVVDWVSGNCDMTFVPQYHNPIQFEAQLEKGKWKELTDPTDHVCQCGDTIKAEDWIRYKNGLWTHKTISDNSRKNEEFWYHGDKSPKNMFVCKLCIYPLTYQEPRYLRFLRWLAEVPSLEKRVKKWLLK